MSKNKSFSNQQSGTTRFELDHDLWRAFISGSQAAFSDLYDRYVDVLYAFGMRYSNDTDLIKDCIHDLFIDLHNYRSGLAKDVNVKFYLLKSLRRKIQVANRKSNLLQIDWLVTDESMQVQTFTFSIEDDIITDENQREMLLALSVEINKLPDRQREILYLRFNHDLEYDEIAAMMHISVPTCRTFIYRAIKHLRTKLDVSYLLLLIWV